MATAQQNGNFWRMMCECAKALLFVINKVIFMLVRCVARRHLSRVICGVREVWSEALQSSVIVSKRMTT